MTYRKIGVRHPQFGQMIEAKEKGHLFCDALAHNSNRGCPNPKCWKYRPKKEKAK